jgi:putative nucleotidyltransferase with HDIG domain
MTHRILAVDDEPRICELLCRSLGQEGYDCASAHDGPAALEAMARRPADLVITDMRMPGMDGRELMLRIVERYPDTPVLIITAISDIHVALDAIRHGAYDYVMKPFSLEELKISVQRALERRKLILENREYQHTLEEKVQQRTIELHQAVNTLTISYQNTLEALIKSLDAREHETQSHSLRVRDYALLLARKMGLEAPVLEDLGRGALLHDIGKIGVSDAILLKPDALNEEEWRLMKQHPDIGFRILEGIEFLKPSRELVLTHHERFDGTGYPRGLHGNEIPKASRIFSLADTFDSMTSNRPYRKAMRPEQAVEELKRHAGKQFDPEVVEAFLQIPFGEWLEIRRRYV